jgi:hypothetical protein
MSKPPSLLPQTGLSAIKDITSEFNILEEFVSKPDWIEMAKEQSNVTGLITFPDEKTINEIASIYEVHPTQVAQWKKLAIEKLPELMADSLAQNG